ncbi:MAG: dihydrofolate reductase family protein [Ignavibacteriaceae bacterium]
MASKRKIIVTEFYSLDGLMSDPGDQMEWVINNFSKDLGEYEDSVYDRADTLLLGRVTYKIFESYWPQAVNDPANPDIKMARKINDITKIVFSKSLQNVEWKNSRIIKEIVPDEINALKQQDGKDMIIVGSADIVQQFTNYGLIDEYHLMLHPVVLGTGKPLFKNIKEKLALKLVDTKKFQNGVTGLFYEPSEK